MTLRYRVFFGGGRCGLSLFPLPNVTADVLQQCYQAVLFLHYRPMELEPVVV